VAICILCREAGQRIAESLHGLADSLPRLGMYPPSFVCLFNLIWNSYLSNVSAELSANVSVLRELLLFRGNQDTCYHPFETEEITIAIN